MTDDTKCSSIGSSWCRAGARSCNCGSIQAVARLASGTTVCTCLSTVVCQTPHTNTLFEGSCTYQNPYIEQQFPLGQFPHTVSLFEPPHVPSVVTRAVAVASGVIEVLTGPITGSPDVVGAVGDPSLQPIWQPLAIRQCPSVVPQNLSNQQSALDLHNLSVDMPVLRATATIWSFRITGSSSEFGSTLPVTSRSSSCCGCFGCG